MAEAAAGSEKARLPVIFHVDMDAFFVSVEELFDPSLRGKPVIVGGKPNERGVVSAASYEARKFGVHSAMPLRTAYRLCPQAIFLEGHPQRYREYSERVYQVLVRFSPRVEMASIDEAYLDMTGTERLHGPPLAAAHKLHKTIRVETGLRCSIGIGTSRVVAKVASGEAKPNGILWVLPGCERRWLSSLEVSRIPGVGEVTEKRLRELGVRKVGDLVHLGARRLEREFGKWGLALLERALGKDAGAWYAEEIGQDEGPKSISHEHTFPEDVSERGILESTLAKLSEKVGRRLREHGLAARTIQLKLRYADFKTITRAVTLDHATDLDTEIYAQVRELLAKNWNLKPVRLLGVHTSSLQSSPVQLSLLEHEKQWRWRKALEAADRIRERYGEEVVSLAAALRGSYREKAHENPAGLPGKRPRK